MGSTCESSDHVEPERTTSPKATESLLSGDLPSLGLGELHLTIPGWDLGQREERWRRRQTTTARKAGDTHGGGHLVQLAHGLVDSSFQVIIQFARSVDDRAQVT